MMKRFLFGALCAGSLFAYNHPCPDHWQVSADFLYVMPSVDDTYFVLKANGTRTFPSGIREHNDFGFQPGFRVGAEYAFCDPQRELQFFYSFLNVNNHLTVSGANLFDTIGRADFANSFQDYAGSAQSTSHLLYERLESLFSQQVLDSAGLRFYLVPGFEYAFMRLKDKYLYNNTTTVVTGEITQKSKSWGLGPQMGFEVEYDFYKTPVPLSPVSKGKNAPVDCAASIRPNIHTLSIHSFFSGSILASRTRALQSAETTTAGATSQLLDIRDRLTWRLIPALHARLGLNYSVLTQEYGIAFEAGYEFNSYIRATQRMILPDDLADSLIQTNYYNFDVQGLYISAALNF